MKRAVCVILKNEFDEYLAVTRKDDHTNFGFPGGAVELGESLIDAIHRETKEETGLEISSLQKIYEGYDDKDYLVTCYSAAWVGKIFIDNKEETGLVKWVSKDILIEQSSFKVYNTKIFQELEFLDKVRKFSTACNAAGIQMDFKTAETISRINGLIEKSSGLTTIDDIVSVTFFIDNKYN